LERVKFTKTGLSEELRVAIQAVDDENKRQLKLQTDIDDIVYNTAKKHRDSLSSVDQTTKNRYAEIRKLMTLITVQQRVLVRLGRIMACERARNTEGSTVLAGWKAEFEHLFEMRAKLFERHMMLTEENSRFKRQAEALKKEFPVVEKRIEGLEKLVALRSLERQRRELLVEEWNIMRGMFESKLGDFRLAGRNTLEEWVQHVERIGKEAEFWYNKAHQLGCRLDTIQLITRIKDEMPDLFLSEAWEDVSPVLLEECHFNWKIDERNLRRIKVDDSQFLPSRKSTNFLIELRGPMDCGSFRAVYAMKDEDGNSFMGKIFHLRRNLETDRECAKRVVKSSLLANATIKAFEAELKSRRSDSPSIITDIEFDWKFNFLDVCLIDIEDPMPDTSRAPEGDPKVTCMMVEPRLDFTAWKKFTDPFGNILPVDSSGAPREEVNLVLDAFSHWSWVDSGKRYIVVDLQGEDKGVVSGEHTVELTDPGIHVVATDLWDDINHDCDGNYRRGGVILYMKNHKCNKYCMLLGIDTDKSTE